MGILGKSKAARLVKADMDETSGVDHPAHLVEGFAVMKNLQKDTVDDVVKTITNEDTMPEETSVEGQEASTDAVDTDVDVLKAKVESLEKQLAEAQESQADAGESTDSDEAILKDVPEQVRKMIEQEREEAQRLNSELRKERDRRLDAEFTETVKKEMGQLSVDSSDLGVALRKLSEIDEGIFKSVNTALKAASEQLDSADIYSQIAKANEVPEDSPEGKLEAIAKSLMSSEKITYAEAITKAAEENVDLYREYSDK